MYTILIDMLAYRIRISDVNVTYGWTARLYPIQAQLFDLLRRLFNVQQHFKQRKSKEKNFLRRQVHDSIINIDIVDIDIS